MKSRITIDFRGVDVKPSGQQFEPVIRALVEDSTDVRDGLMKAFFEKLGGESSWLTCSFDHHIINGSADTKTYITISPVTPAELPETIEIIKNRLKTGNGNYNPLPDDPGLPSRFQIDDEVDFTTESWVEEAWQKAKKDNPGIKEDDLDYVPHYSFGKIAAIKFTKAKVLYDILDDFTGKVVEGVISNYTKKFSEETREQLKN